jgi:hypothetical protein
LDFTVKLIQVIETNGESFFSKVVVTRKMEWRGNCIRPSRAEGAGKLFRMSELRNEGGGRTGSVGLGGTGREPDVTFGSC